MPTAHQFFLAISLPLAHSLSWVTPSVRVIILIYVQSSFQPLVTVLYMPHWLLMTAVEPASNSCIWWNKWNNKNNEYARKLTWVPVGDIFTVNKTFLIMLQQLQSAFSVASLLEQRLLSLSEMSLLWTKHIKCFFCFCCWLQSEGTPALLISEELKIYWIIFSLDVLITILCIWQLCS